MCKGSALIMVDRNGVEGACNEHEVLSISLLTRPRSDHGQSCERVNGQPTLRMVFDKQEQNLNTNKLTSPLPDIEEILHKVSRHKY